MKEATFNVGQFKSYKTFALLMQKGVEQNSISNSLQNTFNSLKSSGFNSHFFKISNIGEPF